MARGQYPTWKGKILQWALEDGPPAGLSLRLALCQDGYVYDEDDQTRSQLEGILRDDILCVVSISETGFFTMDSEELPIAELESNDIITALVFYWKWNTGTQLWLYTTESEEMPLPLEVIGDTIKIKFPDGIYQL